MKVRCGYVSNSSTASFIVLECISLDRLDQILNDAIQHKLEAAAKKKWGVSKLSPRQVKACIRDIPQFRVDGEISTGIFSNDDSNQLSYMHPVSETFPYVGKKIIWGDSCFLGDIGDYLRRNLKVEYLFWG